MNRANSVTLAAAKTYQFMGLLADEQAAPMHGDCSQPYVVELHGRASGLLHRLAQYASDDTMDYIPELQLTLGNFTRAPQSTAYVSVRCRKCPECLRSRARLWTARAIDEIASSTRSWFGTLTLRPEDQFRFRVLAMQRTERGGTRWAQLTPNEQYREKVNAISAEITRFLKRVRKNSDAHIRYMLVSEAHKSGEPHFHLLLHEHVTMATKVVLEASWKLGFSHWRLVGNDKKAAVYACKYLAKSALSRVRASRKYGTDGPRLSTERIIMNDPRHDGEISLERIIPSGKPPLSQKDIGAPKRKL